LAGAFDFSVIVGSGIPLDADKQLRREHFSPFVKLPWSHDLPNGWPVGGMQSLFHGANDVPNELPWESTSYAPQEIIKRSDAFVEYGADYGHGEESRHVVHIGAARRINPRQQLDFHFGFGLSHGSPNHFFAAGYSFRVDRPFRRRE
jgi:hypothetical protein